MVAPDELEKLEASLDPAARYIIGLLQKSNEELKTQNAELSEQIARLTEQLAQMQRMMFGKRSEKMPSTSSEVRRAVSADELTVEGKPMPDNEKERQRERRRLAREKSKPKRNAKRKLRKNLPVVVEQVPVAAEQLLDGMTFEDFRSLGQSEVIRRFDHVREHLVVVEYHQQTLASKDGDHIVQALAPPQVTEGGHFGPGLHAHVAVAKCLDSLPLHRIEKMMERAGCPVARSTLCAIFHRTAELLFPIYQRLLHTVREASYVHANETTLRVQAKDKCFKGWVWVVLCERTIAYTFDKSRGESVATELLGGTLGTLVADGYSGYNAVTNIEGRARVGCWGHARRKFFEAMPSVPEAREALDLILELYKLEHLAAERDLFGTAAHGVLRDTKSRAVVEMIDAWVDERAGKFAPKKKMGQALGYAIRQRERLGRFLDDPKLPLDNNIAERALRIIALGRKNFLFAGHVEGAQNLAILQSIISTCSLHDVNPYDYIKDVIIRVQSHPAKRVDELLPWNWKPAPDAVLTG